MASSNISLNTTDEVNQDLISNLPPIATEKIMKRLPIRMAARMSVLSTEWKNNWLSLRHLVFDQTFWEVIRDPQPVYIYGAAAEAEKVSRIVSNILLHHNGPLQKFYFFCPLYVKGEYLMKLKLRRFVLNPPPRDFKGFADLRSLELFMVKCDPDIFGSLVAGPRLTLLKLEHCIGFEHLIIDIPSLKTLVIKGAFPYLSFENVVRLATCCKLQHLEFWGLCQFSAAGGVAKSFPLKFNYLSKLCLISLNLGRIDVYHFGFGMIQSCPCIKELEISLTSNKNTLVPKLEYDDNFKLPHLRKVRVMGIKGSLAELKFIEYVLAISVVLEKFFFEFGYLEDANSKNLVLMNLLQLPRASPKVQLVCLKQ
ncbi:F-box/FBD/LRR-repeat protein At1g13570-like [Spinacia oleracea]|uniref:F-box/FBD/LRR-repeat protein At1g13570-like n=1 Tax=Spinacia oleracea TaxID=3562 RepID=A0ABM3RP12_SPIOL|nr:F-box/FBD/LRR-repeat protein At1g13570-like [Spinacia oleracea]